MPNNLVIFPIGGSGGSGTGRKDSSGTTTAGFVTLFTSTATGGLFGIGSVKNTDAANTMDVRETVIDAYGVTSNVITSISPGNDYLLDLQTYFGNARPPYTSYAVAVRSTSAIAPATYEMRCITQGVS